MRSNKRKVFLPCPFFTHSCIFYSLMGRFYSLVTFTLELFPFASKSYLRLGNYLKGSEPDRGYDTMKMSSFLAGNLVKASIFSSLIPWPHGTGRSWTISTLSMSGVSFLFAGVPERSMYSEPLLVLAYYRVSSANGLSVRLEKRGEWYWALTPPNDHLKHATSVPDRSSAFFVVVLVLLSFASFYPSHTMEKFK